jgi:hypothetical protein
MSLKRCGECGRIMTDRRYRNKCLCHGSEERVLMNGIQTDRCKVTLTFTPDGCEVFNIECISGELVVGEVERDWTHQRIRVRVKEIDSDLTADAAQDKVKEKEV